jgi:hypothetical protein
MAKRRSKRTAAKKSPPSDVMETSVFETGVTNVRELSRVESLAVESWR